MNCNCRFFPGHRATDLRFTVDMGQPGLWPVTQFRVKGGSGSRAAFDHKALLFSTKGMRKPTCTFVGLLTPFQKSGVGDLVIIASAKDRLHKGLKWSSWVESGEVMVKTQLNLWRVSIFSLVDRKWGENSKNILFVEHPVSPLALGDCKLAPRAP